MPASKFVWYELMTSDTAAAETFYDKVIGWTSRDAGMGDAMPYTLFHVGEAQVAGLMGTPPEAAQAGVPPHWTGYIAVDDVDGMAARVLAAGGKILRPADDIPETGRFAVVADPLGASFALFKPLRDDPPAQPAPGAPGTAGWHEMTTTDWPRAWEFYSSLFGWTKGDAIDMQGAGTYQVFEIDGVRSGGLMNRMDERQPIAWLYYFHVDEINAAVERIRGSGGQILNGPMQVPGGSWIVVGLDPQGAGFAVVQPAATGI